ncbi:MAG TPA: methyltransferase domain-containing protein [Microvirga sp.]|jgi:SAM-dependent methyltransferase
MVAGEAAREARSFLHVGCGQKRKDRTLELFAGSDWREVTLDIDPGAEPDIVDSLPALAKVPDASFDAVFSSHNIEHLYPHEVPAALAAFRRVLRDDGFAVITCPDLQSVGERLAAGDIETPLYTSPAGPVAPLDVLYGFRPSMAAGQLYMAHHTGFTLKSLTNAFKGTGFGTVVGRRGRARGDLWVLATARRLTESEGQDLFARTVIPLG